jgi:hypothetical protein
VTYKNLDDIVGQRIVGVLAKDGDKSPCAQVFLIFEDGSAYEFYSVYGSIAGTWMHGTGGMDMALRYLPNKRVGEQHPVPAPPSREAPEPSSDTGSPLIGDPFVVIVSRVDVEAGQIASTVGVLRSLLESPGHARQYRRRVDIWFHGYDDDRRELWEILEVRHFVAALDEAFPYWFFFLTLEGTGLQALLYCHLPPHMTEEGRRIEWPKRAAELIERRWGPALNEIADWAGLEDSVADALFEEACQYCAEGPRTPGHRGSAG